MITGQAVGLMPRRRLGVDRDDHPRLGVRGDLRSIDQVRPLAGLVAQLGVRIGPRDRGRIGRLALRGRPRPRRSKLQRGPLGRTVTTPTVAVAVDDLQLGAQALQRRVGLDVRRVDDQPRSVQQAGVAATREHLGEQLLKHRRVREAHALRVAERRVMRQRLGQPVAEEPSDRQIDLRDPERLAHRPDPTDRGDQEHLHEHDRIDARPPEIGVKRGRGLPHRAPRHEALHAPQDVIVRHKLVQTDHLDLPGLLTRPDRDRHHDIVLIPPDDTRLL